MRKVRFAIFAILAMVLCLALPSSPASEPIEPISNTLISRQAIKHDDEEDVDYKDDVKSRVVNVHTGTDEIIHTIYSDEIFFKPSDEYHHLLARQSIGFARVAYSLWDEESPDMEDGSLISYFICNGFVDARVDDYDKDTSLYTIGSGIACKEIEYHGEKSTLVAVGIRGNRYKNEWQSNLTLSAGFRHEGFNAAATLVTDRVLSFIAQHEFTSPVKVWITGFSRAGAIANLVAANLNRSSMLSKEQVYAYTFAAPQAIWLGGEDDMVTDFDNIYNILGASDMVPQIVPAEWGYARYGIDKWLPGAEFDSDFNAKYGKVQEHQKQEFGVNTYYNVQLNLRLRLLMGLLLEAVDSDSSYMEAMQPFMVELLASKDINSIMKLLRTTLLQWKSDYSYISEKKDNLIDFVLNMLPSIFMGNGFMKDQVPSCTGKFNVLFHEHFPEVYHDFLYLFSEDELFGSNDDYDYIVLDGEGRIEVKDNTLDKSILTIAGGKKELSETSKELQIDLPLFESGGKSVLILPHDRNYEVAYQLEKGQKMQVNTICYGRRFESMMVSYSLELKGEASGYIVKVDDGGSPAYDGQSSFIRTSEFASLIHIDKTFLPFRGMIMFVVAIFGLIVIGVVWLIEIVNAKLRHGKIGWQKTLIGSLIFLSALEGEILFWIAPEAFGLLIANKVLASLGIVAMYLIDKDIKKVCKNVHRTMLPFLMLMGLGYVLTAVSTIAGLALFIAGLGYLAYYNLSKNKMSMNSWITYAVCSAVGVALIELMFRVSSIDGILFLVAFPLLLLSQFSCLKYEGKKAAASYTLLFAFAMLGLYFLTKFAFFPSMLFVASLSISLSFFAARYDEDYLRIIPQDEEVPAVE